jgi:hypothetical protein
LSLYAAPIPRICAQWAYSGNAFVISFSFNGTVIVKKTSAKKILPAATTVVSENTLFQPASTTSAVCTFQLNCKGAAVANKVRAAHAAH